MKKLMNRPRILIGIFMAPLSLSLIINTLASAQTTPTTDPALAKDPATGALEALAPAGANAPAPAAAPVTPAVQAPAAVVASAPVKLISPSELADIRRSKANSFAFASLPEVSADANGDGHPSENWIADKSNNKSVSIFNYKGGTAMRFQQMALTSTSGAVVTVDMVDKKSTITIFEKKKPSSFTIVRGDDHYTATPAACKILKEQTKSDSFKDMAEKAKTCNAFYDRRPLNSNEDNVAGAILATHKRNLQLMTNSIAKATVPEREVASDFGKFGDWLARNGGKAAEFVTGGGLKKTPMKSRETWKARPILSKSTSKEDAADRQVVEELAGACATLWTDADAEPMAKAAVGGKAGKIAK